MLSVIYGTDLISGKQRVGDIYPTILRCARFRPARLLYNGTLLRDNRKPLSENGYCSRNFFLMSTHTAGV